MLLLNRSFFGLQSPWLPTTVALANLGLNAILDLSFYRLGPGESRSPPLS